MQLEDTMKDILSTHKNLIRDLNRVKVEETEKEYEHTLKDQFPEYNWSVKNQARMHLRNKESPYKSVEDAMKRWPETVTAIGLSLDQKNNIKIIVPHGLNDLFELIGPN
jgi:hypothetical protein